MASHTAARRTHARPLPRHPRRVSGPVARPVPNVTIPAPAGPEGTVGSGGGAEHGPGDDS